MTKPPISLGGFGARRTDGSAADRRPDIDPQPAGDDPVVAATGEEAGELVPPAGHLGSIPSCDAERSLAGRASDMRRRTSGNRYTAARTGDFAIPCPFPSITTGRGGRHGPTAADAGFDPWPWTFTIRDGHWQGARPDRLSSTTADGGWRERPGTDASGPPQAQGPAQSVGEPQRPTSGRLNAPRRGRASLSRAPTARGARHGHRDRAGAGDDPVDGSPVGRSGRASRASPVG
jgi:hypothetical protein